MTVRPTGHMDIALTTQMLLGSLHGLVGVVITLMRRAVGPYAYTGRICIPWKRGLVDFCKFAPKRPHLLTSNSDNATVGLHEIYDARTVS